MGIKSFVCITSLLVLMIVCGCRTASITSSPGGIGSRNETFSIVVPKPSAVKQGAGTTVTLSLKRGSSFKQDVRLDVTARGLEVAPGSVTIKASEPPSAAVQITVPRDTALGDHRVYVIGIPEAGKPTAAEFVVKVVAE